MNPSSLTYKPTYLTKWGHHLVEDRVSKTHFDILTHEFERGKLAQGVVESQLKHQKMPGVSGATGTIEVGELPNH